MSAIRKKVAKVLLKWITPFISKEALMVLESDTTQQEEKLKVGTKNKEKK